MTFYIYAFQDIDEMRTVHPGSSVPVGCTIMGEDYPVDENYSVYIWDDAATALESVPNIIKPTQDPTDNGRWLKITIDQVPQVNADWSASSGPAHILNKPTLFSGAYVDLTGKPALFSGAYTDLSGKPSLAAVATSGSYTDLSNKPSIPAAASQSAASRSLNTAFQVSSTRGAFVSYSVQLTVTASIAGGQNGDVILEIASDSGFTTNVQTVAIAGLGQTYTLAVAIQGVQPQTGCVAGFVPAGYYARLRTVNNTGTPTYSVRAGQETLV